MSKNRKGTAPQEDLHKDQVPSGQKQDNTPTGKEQEYVPDNDPPLTEEDLEENDLSTEEADEIEWDTPEDLDDDDEEEEEDISKPEGGKE